tara:strand:- start:775 stop:945 length:171 start_codon:yes stop_codon:yes gene_type:complete
VKVGDLVRDKDESIRGTGEIGIIIKIDEPEGMFKVMFNNGSEWLTEMFLEVISESR